MQGGIRTERGVVGGGRSVEEQRDGKGVIGRPDEAAARSEDVSAVHSQIGSVIVRENHHAETIVDRFAGLHVDLGCLHDFRGMRGEDWTPALHHDQREAR